MILTIPTTSMSVALITCATIEVSDAVVTPVVVTSSIVIATVACVVLVMVVAVIIDAPAPAPLPLVALDGRYCSGIWLALRHGIPECLVLKFGLGNVCLYAPGQKRTKIQKWVSK